MGEGREDSVQCTCGKVQPRSAFLRPFVMHVGADEATGRAEFVRMATCPECCSTVTIQFWQEEHAAPCAVCARAIAGVHDDPVVVVHGETWCTRCSHESYAAHPYLQTARVQSRLGFDPILGTRRGAARVA